MSRPYKSILVAAAVVGTLVASSSQVGANVGSVRAQQGDAAETREANARRASLEHYGVPLAAPVYFVNFMLLYMANPNRAADMPAYRATLPDDLAECLRRNPTGCDY